MTSADTLGYGTTSGVSTVVPSVNVNSSISDKNRVPQLSRAKVSSIEAGLSNSIGVSSAGTYTVTPRQIGDVVITPAMGPDDELSPFVRTLQSKLGTVGQPSEPPIRYLGRRVQDPLGDGMGGWTGSLPSGNTESKVDGSGEFNGNAGGVNAIPMPVAPFATGVPPVPFLPPAPKNAPGGLPGLMVGAGLIDPSNSDLPPPSGLLGLMQEYMRNNPASNS